MPNVETEQRQLAAIMFTDMVGYSALAQRNEALALELLEEHRCVLRSIFPKHKGREIETAGDAFLVEFVSALEAVRCAVEIQEKLSERNRTTTAERAIRIRIGIHVGDVVHREGKVMGDAVNIAARIEPLALPGGICVSEDVARQIHNKLDRPLVTLGPSELKNIELPVVICRVVLPWEKHEPDSSSRVASIERPKPIRALAATVVVIAVLSVAIWFSVHRRTTSILPADATNTVARQMPASPGRIEWLVVLPLRNHSGDTNQDFFVDGMTEILIGELGQIAGLKLKSHTTSMHYKGTKKSVPEIGQELRVDAVVEGSVLREGDQVLISVRLIEAATDRLLWPKKFQRDLTHALKMQSEVAEAIAREIRGRLSPQDEARLVHSHQVDPQALEAYLKGRFFWNKRTVAALRTAIEHFQEAIRFDSRFAPAYAALGLCYAALPIYTTAPSQEYAAQAKRALATALELDPTLGEAHASLGFVKLAFASDWAGAETEFRQAITLSPNSALVHKEFSKYCWFQGRFSEALTEMKRAEEIDPLSLIIKLEVGDIFLSMGQQDQAIAQYRQTLELDPNFGSTHLSLGRALTSQAKYAEAIQALNRAAELSPDSEYVQAFLGRTYVLAGRREEAERILQELKDPHDLAVLCTALGDKERALRWLEKAYERGFVLMDLKIATELDTLRSDPRFQELLRKVGLDK